MMCPNLAPSIRWIFDFLPFILQQHLHSDESCYLRFHFRSPDLSIAKPATIKSHTNETHSLLLAVDRQLSLRHLGQPQFKLSSEWIQIGLESPEHQFVFKTVTFDQLLSEIAEDVIPYFYKTHQRTVHYCPIVRQRQIESFPKYKMSLLGQRSHRHLDHDILPKPQSIAVFEELFYRCNFSSSLTNRTKCRNSVRSKCRETLIETSDLCDKLAVKKKALKAPWDVKQCDKLDSRTDKKLCRRQKRQICKRKVAKRHPAWTSEAVVQKCKDARKKFQKCVRRKMRRDETMTKKYARKICKKKTRKSGRTQNN